MPNPYFDFINKRNLQTVSIYGVRFHINPDSFQATSERVHYDTQTLGGFGRTSYTTKPTVYTLEGFTGTDGVNGINAMDKFRPIVGRQDILVPFIFPARYGTKPRMVYVNSFQDSMSRDMHLYNQYQIELVEYPPTATLVAYRPAPGSTTGSTVSIIGGGFTGSNNKG